MNYLCKKYPQDNCDHFGIHLHFNQDIFSQSMSKYLEKEVLPVFFYVFNSCQWTNKKLGKCFYLNTSSKIHSPQDWSYISFSTHYVLYVQVFISDTSTLYRGSLFANSLHCGFLNPLNIVSMVHAVLYIHLIAMIIFITKVLKSIW